MGFNLDGDDDTDQQFVSITDSIASPTFQIYQIEHPTYKSRLLGIIVGFSTALLFFRMLLGAIYLSADPLRGNLLAPSWTLSFALTIMFFPQFLLAYQISMVLFAGHFYHYYPYNNHTNRNSAHIGSLLLNLIFPAVNLTAFTIVNALLLTRLISDRHYVSVPFFVLFNLVFTLYLLGVVMNLELSSVPLNFHCTGSVTHPTAADLHQYHPLLYIPPASEDRNHESVPFAGSQNISRSSPRDEQMAHQQLLEPPTAGPNNNIRVDNNPTSNDDDEEEGPTEPIQLPDRAAFMNVLGNTCRYTVI